MSMGTEIFNIIKPIFILYLYTYFSRKDLTKMAKILVYNNDNNRMETYYRGESEAMPYNTR